jgi:hypothetical protein
VRLFDEGGCLSEGTGIVAVLGDGCTDFGVAGSRYVENQLYPPSSIIDVEEGLREVVHSPSHHPSSWASYPRRLVLACWPELPSLDSEAAALYQSCSDPSALPLPRVQPSSSSVTVLRRWVMSLATGRPLKTCWACEAGSLMVLESH